MRCKICNNKFEPKYFLQKSCFNPDCILKWNEKVKADKWKAKKKVLKERLKTKSDYLKELQIVFNKFIRLRDQNKPCISCGKPYNENEKRDASHFRSVGSTPELRFCEENVHASCVHCNRYLHGNLINYRIGLIERVGVDSVEWLEGNHELKKYTIPELKELKEIYKKKVNTAYKTNC